MSYDALQKAKLLTGKRNSPGRGYFRTEVLTKTYFSLQGPLRAGALFFIALSTGYITRQKRQRSLNHPFFAQRA